MTNNKKKNSDRVRHLVAPFPWFGGKRRVAGLAWLRFGDVVNYVEPFAGSLAVLLGRPHAARNETVNDLDCYVANFWRALKHDADGVAQWADDPVNEADLHAKHEWLHGRAGFRERMHRDIDFYDVQIAGWWVWGISAWIGDNWCRTKRQASTKDGAMQRFSGDGTGRDRRRPDLPGCGVHRLGDQKMPEVRCSRGVNAMQVPDISGDGGAVGRGVHARRVRCGIYDYMRLLAARLRRVRVCCGDWRRVLGPSPTIHIGTTAVLLDPPYGVADRDKVYAEDGMDIAGDVRAWALAHGAEPKLRIAVCGYAGEHDALEAAGWSVTAWRAAGGYANAGTRANKNRHRERIWFSPHCLRADQAVQGDLFGGGE